MHRAIPPRSDGTAADGPPEDARNEHWTRIPKLENLCEQTVLKSSPHNRCGASPQSTGTIAAIPKAVHLLAYNIGGLTYATTEQIRRFQKRGTNFTETGPAEMLGAIASTTCQRWSASGSRSTMPLRLWS